jgi:galactonate dehydratase
MKITAVKPFVVEGGLGSFFFVKVETDEGIYGVGEGGNVLRAPALAEVVRSYAEQIVGADPSRIEHLWQMMYRGGFFPGGVVQSCALSAVDMALWDIKGKALGVPVYELLGGRTRDRVVCYPHNGETGDIDKLIASCRQTTEAGWKFVRWGLGDPAGGDVFEPTRAVKHGIESVAAVREALGDEIEILVDVHTRLDPPASIEFCQGVEQYRPFFVEDPLRSENPSSLRLLRGRTSTPIAIGEQFTSKWEFRQAIEEDLMDYCRMDVGVVGGLTEARKVAAWCETHYIALAPHNPNGPGVTAATLHLCLASPHVGVMELSSPPGSAFTDIFPVQAPFADGHMLPPDRPGLGIEFNEEAAVESSKVAKAIGYYRDDGAYTNW